MPIVSPRQRTGMFRMLSQPSEWISVVVEEVRGDVLARAADIRLAAEDHPLHPRRVGHRLAPANRIGLRLVAVETFRLLQRRMVHQHGEQDVARRLGQSGIDRAEGRAGWSGSACAARMRSGIYAGARCKRWISAPVPISPFQYASNASRFKAAHCMTGRR